LCTEPFVPVPVDLSACYLPPELVATVAAGPGPRRIPCSRPRAPRFDPLDPTGPSDGAIPSAAARGAQPFFEKRPPGGVPPENAFQATSVSPEFSETFTRARELRANRSERMAGIAFDGSQDRDAKGGLIREARDGRNQDTDEHSAR
jgi:hypothetical protein